MPDPRAMLRNYHATFSTAAGQAVLEDLMKAYVWRTSHTPGDPYTTAFYEGQRQVVLNIRKAMLEAASQHPPDMVEAR